VIDQNLLATTILEVGPGRLTHQRTGRMAVIPNSLFVSEPVINESFTHNYVLHVFTVPFKREDHWQAAQEAFLASALRHCKPHLADAAKYMKQVSEDRGLQVPSVEPRVTLQVPNAMEIHLIVRIPTPAGQRSYIEQATLQDVFAHNNFTTRPAAGELPAVALPTINLTDNPG
jgi:small-conductance mechanosensitive channel